jgi:hypothetical protein
MNQRVEITVEGVLNNFTHKLCIPVGASFDDALQMVDLFKAEVQKMKDIAANQQAMPAPSNGVQK